MSVASGHPVQLEFAKRARVTVLQILKARSLREFSELRERERRALARDPVVQEHGARNDGD